jgi:hypothetical protein
MNRYQTLQKKAVGLGFILGPLLMMLGAAAYVMGIGLTPFGTDSWVDGILSAYGFLILIPVSFELARILGQRSPVFGLVCAIMGMGWGMSIVAAALKVIQMAIINAGLNESIWVVIDAMPATSFILIGSLVGMLSMLLLGVGLLWKGGIPSWAAGLLIVGTILYAIGVGGGADIAWWQTSVAVPLGCLAYFAALAPTGLRYLTGDSQVVELSTATA